MKSARWVAGGGLACSLALVVLMLRPAEERQKHWASSPSTKAPPVEASVAIESPPDAGIAATVVPSVSDPRWDLDVEPHPLTAERQAFARQHALFAAVEEAIQGGSFGLARDLLAEHERYFGDGEDWRDQRIGFELIIDCLEHPGDETGARAAEFMAQERLSPLRRRVRRTCLLGLPFHGRRSRSASEPIRPYSGDHLCGSPRKQQ